MSNNFCASIAAIAIATGLGLLVSWSYDQDTGNKEREGLYGSYPISRWQQEVEEWREGGCHGARPRFF